MEHKSVKWVQLGDYISLSDERNTEGKYGIDDVKGVSINKSIIDTKANMSGVSLTPYKLFKPEQFCYVSVTSRNGEKITLTLNDKNRTFIVSSSYIVFEINNRKDLLPEYVFLWLSRPEFDRYARFNSWGSARETFSWEEMCRVEIPLPSINEQQELVNVWQNLKDISKENEAVASPLEQLCRSYMQKLKHVAPLVELGDYIEEYDKRNTDNSIKTVKGVSVKKTFVEVNAKVNKKELRNYKIVPPMYIAYVQTTKNEKCFAFGLNRTGNDIVVSSVDKVIKTRDNDVLNIEFLDLWFKTKEFDRFAIYNSWGSAREVFSYSDLCRSKIPLPSIEQQRAIISLAQCANKSKEIAAKAKQLSIEVCPALMQKAIRG